MVSPRAGGGGAVIAVTSPAESISSRWSTLRRVKSSLGLVVEAAPDAVEDGGDVLAHAGVVGAGAVHLDSRGVGEEALSRAVMICMTPLGELALEQLDHGTDLAGAGGS